MSDFCRNSVENSMNSETANSLSRLSSEPPTISPEHPPPLPVVKSHRSSDSSSQAIRSKTGLNFQDFSLIHDIGSGDIGRVYLCRLRDAAVDDRLYAMKVVDNQVLAMKKKTQRAEIERKILGILDHPFLPKLYAEFENSHFSCVVMEYCSGGDLHSLRHKQLRKRFSVASARFYAAEVLVALEYLHLLGIVYRDLKPENVLVKSDGHIMLTDFDLCLCSDAIPAVESPDYSSDQLSSTPLDYSSGTLSPFNCFSNRLFRSKKIQSLSGNRLFVAEPVNARSCSFVGTHEYVAPEVASGSSHGNAVDWWALGIFIYEMIYGRTPFAGASNEITLHNIIKSPLTFPTGQPSGSSEMHARRLISGLLNKDPSKRLGSKRGAADIKSHPFFKGLNFALIRSVTPPGVSSLKMSQSKENKVLMQQTTPFNVF